MLAHLYPFIDNLYSEGSKGGTASPHQKKKKTELGGNKAQGKMPLLTKARVARPGGCVRPVWIGRGSEMGEGIHVEHALDARYLHVSPLMIEERLCGDYS